MKKWLALLCSLALLVPTALADVIFEPEDAFYAAHRGEFEYLYREYTANGPEGYTTLWKAPDSAEQRENVANGETFSGLFLYTAGGETWSSVSGEGETLRGWVRLSDCTPVPDYLTFEEAHGAEFVPCDSSYDHAFDGLETVVLWKYPGSGIVEWADCDAKWFRENGTPSQTFQSCWEDEDGRVWGFVGYVMGVRNVWVCLSDPANQDLPASAAVLPLDAIAIPPAGEIPAPKTSGMEPVTVVLVVLVVAATAALIYLLFRKRR